MHFQVQFLPKECIFSELQLFPGFAGAGHMGDWRFSQLLEHVNSFPKFICKFHS
jgi:hypothetical protein